jgi:hypothetical protein
MISKKKKNMIMRDSVVLLTLIAIAISVSIG